MVANDVDVMVCDFNVDVLVVTDVDVCVVT